jgi:hypothetical protein
LGSFETTTSLSRFSIVVSRDHRSERMSWLSHRGLVLDDLEIATAERIVSQGKETTLVD